MATPSGWTLTVGGAAVNAETANVSLGRLSVDARTGQTLDFTENVLHFDNSWDEGDSCVLEYPTGTTRFSGRITRTKRVGRSGQESVRYTASDWRIMGQSVQVTRRGPDHTDGEDTYPERIYNAPAIDPDAKYNALSSASSTVGQILTDLFDDFDTYLVAEAAVGVTAYDTSDLTALSHVPGKTVLSGLNFEQAVITLLAEQGPAWACWVDTTGKWRFWDTRSAPSTNTVTIASDDVEDTDLERHIRGRYTAVNIHGKPGAGEDVFPEVAGFGTDETGTTMSGLTKLWSGAEETNWNRIKGSGYHDAGAIASTGATSVTLSGRNWTTDIFDSGYAVFPRYSWSEKFTINGNDSDTIQLSSSRPGTGADAGDPVYIQSETGALQDVFRLYQITDADKRDIVTTGAGEVDCCPHVIGTLRSSGGAVVGTDHVAIRIEGDGIFRTEIPMITSDSNGYTPGDSTLWPDWKLVYCYRDPDVASTLVARYPTSSYSGEASGAPWSIQRELQVVVPEFDDQADVAVYQSVAEEIHKTTSSVGLSGRVTLAGVNWTYLDPRQQVHVAHAADTTGWEALGASLTATNYDFRQTRTTLNLSDAGDTQGIDYQALVSQILAKQEQAQAQAEAEKLSNFINCRDRDYSGTRDYSKVVGEAAQESTEGYTLQDPGYTFPRGAAGDSMKTCLCDDQGVNGAIHCEAGDRSTLTVKHPHVTHSELAWAGSATCAPYYPFACKGTAIDPANNFCPDGTASTASCNTGSRELISIEPFGIDNGSTGTEISPAQLLLLSIKANDNYMQQVQEALCCLDNRIACLDADIWGGVGCHRDNGAVCPQTIAGAVAANCAQLKSLKNCVNNINYQTGPSSPNCTVTCSEDFEGCGAC